MANIKDFVDISNYDYIELDEVINNQFLKVPTSIFGLNISAEAKLLYALLKDRYELTIKNNWIDDEGKPFIYFSREDVEDILNISHPTCVKKFDELKQVGLINEVRQGVNKPNKIYVKSAKNTINTWKLKNLTSSNSWKLKNLTSRSKNSLLQEVKELNDNHTEINHTNTIVSDSDSKNKIFSSEPSKNGSETESFIDDDTFLRNLTDEQYRAFEELLNRIKRRELNSSKASLIAYFKKLMQNSWKDSKGKEIKNIVGYVVMNFVSHDKDVHTAEIKLREQGFEPGSTVVPFKKETVRNKKEDILVEYDTSKNPEFNEERYNEIMSKRKIN